MTSCLTCPYCNAENIKPNGFDRHKIKRRYRCKSCSKSFQNCYDSVGSEPGVERKIMMLINDGKTYLSVSSILGVSSKKIARSVRNHREMAKTPKD